MENKRNQRRKKEKQLMAFLIFLFTLMLASVFGLVIKTAVKKSAGNGNVQVVETLGKEPETEQEREKNIYKDYVLEIPVQEPESETETETESETETEEETETETEEEDTSQEEEEKAWTTEELLEKMTTEEKVAQLFMVTPEALTGYDKVTSAEELTQKALEEYPVGGLIYFAQNFVSPEQTKEMTGNVQKFAGDISVAPLFLATDEEGGRVTRIGGNSAFEVETVPDMASIGEGGDTQKAFQAGKTIGKYLYELGINVDFAPVADVLTNSDNQVIGNRSFGSRAEIVAHMDESLMEGLMEEKVQACVKHFPGHGSTAGDTHSGAVSLDKTLEELEDLELRPFQRCIDNGVPFVMVGHIELPQVTGNDRPASLSKEVITDILRKKMGYQGIVITDAMNMGAITNRYNSREAAVMAIQAGADMLLMPDDFKEAYKGILEAIENGDLEKSRVDEAVKRILDLKFQIK